MESNYESLVRHMNVSSTGGYSAVQLQSCSSFHEGEDDAAAAGISPFKLYSCNCPSTGISSTPETVLAETANLLACKHVQPVCPPRSNSW